VTSNDLEVVTFDDSDLDQVIEIEEASFPDPIPRSLFASFKLTAGKGFIVAHRNGRVVGYLILEARKDGGHILSLAVAPGERRMGVGEALLVESIHRYSGTRRRLSRWQKRRMYCEIRVSNRASISLFRKLLFKETGEVKKGAYPDGEDGTVMERFV